MNSGITSERVYAALKKRLLGGEFKPGERLDPALLSETLASSVTPVRDVLNTLTGEGLIDTRTGEGFYRPNLTAPDLEDLYAWSSQVLGMILRHADRPATTKPVSDTSSSSVGDRAATLFLLIAERSSNAEHHRAITMINDRLHPVRMIEPLVLVDMDIEIGALEASFASTAPHELARLLTSYYRRRIRAASDIVRAVYRGA